MLSYICFVHVFYGIVHSHQVICVVFVINPASVLNGKPSRVVVSVDDKSVCHAHHTRMCASECVCAIWFSRCAERCALAYLYME